jgi:phosphoribosylamine--glycine ligase
VPTAGHETFVDLEPALARAREIALPAVLKADGLAAGKGVVIARERPELLKAMKGMLSGDSFGDAGRRVVLEEFLEGREVSVLAIADGERFIVLPPARDFKRAGEGDTGPNTGGMGSYAPLPDVGSEIIEGVCRDVLEPVLAELRGRDIKYRGCLYAGLMLTAHGPKVLEFNCRFGDPETQAVLPALGDDLLDLLEAAAQGGLGGHPRFLAARRASVCVVLASGGYPGDHETGFEMTGLDEAARDPDVLCFHAGTRRERGRMLTAGGRVLNVVGLGASHPRARERAYAAAAKVRFDGAQYRRDIAAGVE